MKSEPPMILGSGIDIVEIQRIRNAYRIHGSRLLARLFTAEEQAYCLQFSDPSPHLAARFAAKEAVAKAMGTGIGRDLKWLEIALVKDARGRPLVSLVEDAAIRFNHPNLLLTLSHCRAFAVASVLWLP